MTAWGCSRSRHATGADDTGPLVARYLVTFIKSRTTDTIRTATAVSVTNQTGQTCQVAIDWFQGFNPTPVCTTAFSLDAGFRLTSVPGSSPDPLTTCNATCAPELTFDEGKAVVSANCQAYWGECARVLHQGPTITQYPPSATPRLCDFDERNLGD